MSDYWHTFRFIFKRFFDEHDREFDSMAQKHAVVKQLQGITFTAKSDSNHWITMDGPEALGGSDAGPRPKELLLMGLGGCTASDVVSILKKKHTPFENVEVHLTANVKEDHPQVFTDIHIEYIISGDGVNPADVERAVELSTTKYCAVSAMLRGNINITHSHRIKPSEKSSAHCEAV
jgi:putative redox protein